MYKHPLLNRDKMTPKEALDILVEGNNRFVNNFGFAVDDLSIPETGWVDNAESGDKDWISGGFVRIRQFGFLANRVRGAKLALCRKLLGAAAPAMALANPGSNAKIEDLGRTPCPILSPERFHQAAADGVHRQ